MLTIHDSPSQPVHWLRYMNAKPGGGLGSAQLVVERTFASGLPHELDALVATSDLQGIVSTPHTGESRLLGEAVAEALEELALDGVLPSPDRTGILLAGDLYSVPTADKRGGYGDVGQVWSAFAKRFAWVKGVAGNHDDVGRVDRTDRVTLLDGEIVDASGLRVGGVGLIAGNPQKRGRRAEVEQLERIALIASEGVDVLVLHEGPSGDGPHQRGHPDIRAIIEEHAVPLTICGHEHWEPALARHARGQILNVDSRVVVLVRR